VTSRSISTSTAGWRHKKQPTSGEFWRTSRTTKDLRDRQGIIENQLLSAPAASWPEAAAKARYVLNLYAAGLAPADTHHRDLVAAVLADFARLSNES
jgi:hypothetical protein